MKKGLLFFYLILLALTSFSQEMVDFNGKRYEKRSNKVWFDVETGFEIDSTVITIKLKPNIQSTKITQIGKIIRQNSLGYIDVDISTKKGFFVELHSLAKDNDILSIDVNTIGTYNRIQFLPNDPELSEQWYLGRIKAFDAWDIITGSTCVTIGVLDSGTDWSHDDLGLGTDTYQNIWLNPGEDIWTNPNNPTTGNGIDDDSDGLVDNWKGWNYSNNTNDTRTTNEHGTQIAGIIAAKTNNGNGIAGVAGGNNGQGVQILPICIGVTAPNTSVMDDAILHAVDKGVRVIQISASVGSTSAINDAIQYATDNGVIVVCAAGNNNGALSFPANNINTISVGATNQSDQKASFSNYGSTLDLAAPGVDIYSTVLNNQYGSADGTSFSAPMVSATIGLMLSINSSLSPTQVRNILTSTAEKVGGYTYIGGRCNEIGYGLLNAHAAVQAVAPTITGPDQFCPTATYTLTNLPAGATIVSWTASPSGVVTLSGSGNTRTLTRNAGVNSFVTLTATISTTCGNVDINRTIYAGIPSVADITFENGFNGASYFCDNYGGNTVHITTHPEEPDLDFEVQILTWPGLVVLYTGNTGASGTLPYVPPTLGLYMVRARVINHPCGTGDWSSPYGVEYVNCAPGQLSVRPNPADETITVTMVRQADGSTVADEADLPVFTAVLYDGADHQIRKGESKDGTVRFDTQDLPEGKYRVQINQGERIESHEVVVKH